MLELLMLQLIRFPHKSSLPVWLEAWGRGPGARPEPTGSSSSSAMTDPLVSCLAASVETASLSRQPPWLPSSATQFF